MPQSKRVESALSAELNEAADANVRHRMLQIFDSLDEQERVALWKVMAKIAEKNADRSLRTVSQYSYRWLAETLTKHGHPINKNQVRHFMLFVYPKMRGEQ